MPSLLVFRAACGRWDADLRSAIESGRRGAGLDDAGNGAGIDDRNADAGQGVFWPSRPSGGTRIRRNTGPSVLPGCLLPLPQRTHRAEVCGAVGDGDAVAAAGALALAVRQGQARAALARLEMFDADGGEFRAVQPTSSSARSRTPARSASIGAGIRRRIPAVAVGTGRPAMTLSKGVFTNQQGICKRPFAEVAECLAGGGTGSSGRRAGREGG